MRVDYTLKNTNFSKIVKDALDKNIQKIKRRMKLFKNDDSVHLIIDIEKNPHKEVFDMKLKLFMPHKTVKAETTDKNLSKAITESFAALIKQIDKYKHILEKHINKKRTSLTK